MRKIEKTTTRPDDIVSSRQPTINQKERIMSIANLTETKHHEHRITMFVPLFMDGDHEIGIHISIFERFGAWSFEMKSDIPDCTSLIKELFDYLCRISGLRRRITCIIELELPPHDPFEEFTCGHDGALTCGDFFTLEAIHYLLATACIPYWQHVARLINQYDRGNGWKDTRQRAIDALCNWKRFDRYLEREYRWENSLIKAARKHKSCKYLTRGDNWRTPIEYKPLNDLGNGKNEKSAAK